MGQNQLNGTSLDRYLGCQEWIGSKGLLLCFKTMTFSCLYYSSAHEAIYSGQLPANLSLGCRSKSEEPDEPMQSRREYVSSRPKATSLKQSSSLLTLPLNMGNQWNYVKPVPLCYASIQKFLCTLPIHLAIRISFRFQPNLLRLAH